MKRILVVEDEANIREFVVINLNRAGYDTVEAASGEEALRVFDECGEFDMALLDIALPGMDGLAVCRELRRRSKTMGIIMLTARTQEQDKVSGLMMGADDYVTKPFSPSELVARVDSLYRRVSVSSGKKGAVAPGEEILLGDFTLNLRRHSLTKRGREIELTQVEFKIIEYFFNNPDVVLDRTDILNRAWGDDYCGEEKIVDVNIRRMRMKVEDDPGHPQHIVTVWGLGYKWVTV
ncbi:MAG: response regulator transcription factor [Clostridia bacterium]|nr:response regulator transcription factor [Clostridia bacterium]